MKWKMGKKRKGKERTYFDSQHLSSLPAGSLNLELHLQHINLFQELIGDLKWKGEKSLAISWSSGWKYKTGGPEPRLQTTRTERALGIIPRYCVKLARQCLFRPSSYVFLRLFIPYRWDFRSIYLLCDASDNSHLPPVQTVSDWLHPSAFPGSQTNNQTSKIWEMSQVFHCYLL